jgi:hypothetical protein
MTNEPTPTPAGSKFQRLRIPSPPNRRLRAFAFDPILSRKIDTFDINEIVIKLPWKDILGIGPVDDYLEVVDYDPASQAFYSPVDLNDRYLLAQDGLPASDGNPQFHQQMVYAVARNTIGHFEQALGRRPLWSPHGIHKDFVEHLRIYPHALREANAYYSTEKKALLFGYFPASATTPGENMPGEIVFTCLSHDIVAHETSHALLDGMHPRFIEPTNIDVWALHEAFADIVALFQHFTYPEVLRRQIAETRGDLSKQNLLGGLAYQFGQAIGRYGSLRDALGSFDPQTNEWTPEKPDPEKILLTTEPHERGAILVAAVFEAFLTIYKRRITDLMRIATGGSGVLPPGDLHPDLVERLAQEAAKTASHVLHICIRALDYCPPVDVDFGDYLRALITADADLVADDRFNYRLAFVEAFRQRGIYPRDVRNLSEESLMWYQPDEEEQKAFLKVFQDPDRLQILVPDWGLTTDPRRIYDQTKKSRRMLHGWFVKGDGLKAAKVANLVLDKNAREAFYRDEQKVPMLEVHSVRPTRRVGPDGQIANELVVEMTQRRGGYYDPERQAQADSDGCDPTTLEFIPDFIYRGGCTLIIDPDTAKVRYCIYKRIKSKNRLERTRRFLTEDENPSLRTTYFGDPRKYYFERITKKRKDQDGKQDLEPFLLLHRSLEKEEVI